MHPSRFRILAAVLLLSGATQLPAEPEMKWRKVEAENTVFMELPSGRVIIELNPVFAPKTVAQFQRLVQSRFYDGLSFYRVIDGFVAQGGDGSDLGELSEAPPIEAEFEMDWSEELPFVSAQKPDLFAAETGFVDGFAVARDQDRKKIWLTHCPGIIAMARNDDPDSSRTDFYIVIGQAPRYLDRNLTIFGHVVDGMEYVQQIHRGPADNNGIFQDDTSSTRMLSVKLGSEIPEADRPTVYVMDSASAGFERLLDGRRDRTQTFFHHKPPAVLDVCQVPLGSMLSK